MKKAFSRHVLQTILIYTFCYGIQTFTLWEVKNPFQWLIDLPTYERQDRFNLIVLFLIYNPVSVLLWKTSINEKQQNNDTRRN